MIPKFKVAVEPRGVGDTIVDVVKVDEAEL
jgi:hypothetical protein